MKKYVVKEYVSSVFSYIMAFAVMVLVDYFFNGKKLTARNFIFASIVTVGIILMDIKSNYKRKKKNN